MTKSHDYSRLFSEKTPTINKTGTFDVGAISKAQNEQFSKYVQNVFMKNSCFRTTASSLIKRNIVRT